METVHLTSDVSELAPVRAAMAVLEVVKVAPAAQGATTASDRGVRARSATIALDKAAQEATKAVKDDQKVQVSPEPRMHHRHQPKRRIRSLKPC